MRPAISVSSSLDSWQGWLTVWMGLKGSKKGAFYASKNIEAVSRQRTNQVRQHRPLDGLHRARGCRLGAYHRKGTCQDGDREIRRRDGDGGFAGKPENRLAGFARGDRMRPGEVRVGRGVQSKISGLRDRSDAAVWEFIWDGGVRRAGSDRER